MPDISERSESRCSFLMLWAQVHGLVTLYTKERLNIYAEADQKQLMFDAYEIFFGAIKKCLS